MRSRYNLSFDTVYGKGGNTLANKADKIIRRIDYLFIYDTIQGRE